MNYLKLIVTLILLSLIGVVIYHSVAFLTKEKASDDFSIPTHMPVSLFTAHQPESIEILSNSTVQISKDSTFRNLIATIQPNYPFILNKTESNNAIFDLERANRFWIRSLEDSVLTFKVQTPDTTISHTYEGIFNFSRFDFEIINYASFELYLQSVVASEFPFDALEGAKAQGILARTYALKRFLEHRIPLQDNELAQVYRGVKVITPTTKKAIQETKNTVLVYKGFLVEALYSASNGGMLAHNNTIWGGEPLSYFVAKTDSFDMDSPYQKWTASYDKKQLLTLLSAHFNQPVENFYPTDLQEDLRWKYFQIEFSDQTKKKLLTYELRTLLNHFFGTEQFRSTLFNFEDDGNTITLVGKGFGHGVGFSQFGGLYRSQAGQSALEILQFYYKGVTTLQLY